MRADHSSRSSGRDDIAVFPDLMAVVEVLSPGPLRSCGFLLSSDVVHVGSEVLGMKSHDAPHHGGPPKAITDDAGHGPRRNLPSTGHLASTRHLHENWLRKLHEDRPPGGIGVSPLVLVCADQG
jgi:hypothetical protein